MKFEWPSFEVSSSAFAQILPIGVILIMAGVIGYLIGPGNLNTNVIPITLAIFVSPIILFVSTEMLLWISLASILLTDTWLLSSNIVFYLRYIPMALLSIHGIITVSVHREKRANIPVFFLLPMGMLAFLALLSTLYAYSPGTTFQRALSVSFAVMAFGISVPIMIAEERVKSLGLNLIRVCSVFIILSLGFVLLRRPEAILDYDTFFRANGVFLNPNTLGVVCMYTILTSVPRWMDRSDNPRRHFYLIPIVASLLGLLLSGSRDSFLGMTSGLIVLVVLLPLKTKRRIVVPLVLGSALMFFVLPNVAGGYLLTTDDSARFQTWRIALDLGMKSPIYGTGFSTDEIVADNRQIDPGTGYNAAGGHNEFLRVFLGLGLAGLSLLLLTLVVLIYKGFKCVRHASDSEIIWLAGLFAVVIGGAIHAVFEDGLLSFGGSDAFIYWFFAAILAAEIQKRSQKISLPVELVRS